MLCFSLVAEPGLFSLPASWRLSCFPEPEVGRMFRVLVVDDDQAGSFLLQGVMQNLQLQHELYFTRDGLEALDLLHRRGDYAGSPRPHLILLNMNMPHLGGLETLSAIKSDPELRVIPVIMLSSANPP